MTRKRKNVEQEENPPSVEKKTFPPKNRGRFSQKDFNEDDFAQKYGYVGGNDAPSENRGKSSSKYSHENSYNNHSESLEWASKEPEVKESPFPTEIVSYLRSMSGHLEIENDIDNDFLDKCVEECAGHEVTLLSFRDACVVVEKVFGSRPYGAELFLKAVSRLKHKVVVDLMFGGCSARTIETLLYACAPVESEELVEILSKFVDLLCDNWNDAICTQPSSYILRCIGRITCGLKMEKKAHTNNTFAKEVPKFSSQAIKESLQRLFSQLMDRAADVKATGTLFDNLFCSLVLQSFLTADAAVDGKRADRFVENVINNLKEPEVVKLLQGKESSRIWECVFVACEDDTLKKFWDHIVSKNFKDLVYHPKANFPLQRLISSVKSQDLATVVSSTVIPLISTLLAENRGGIVNSLIKCCIKYPELQEGILKELRKHFNADKSDTKHNFLFNILTSNKYDGTNVNLNNCQISGSLLLQDLFSFTKVKTLSACIEAIPPQTLFDMSMHKMASHVIQAVLKSSTVANEVKEKILNCYENKWTELITNSSGSHVFEAVWDCPLLKVAKKQDLMKSFVAVRIDHRNWKFTMLRCDMNLFRKDRKAWVTKQKNWNGNVKHC